MTAWKTLIFAVLLLGSTQGIAHVGIASTVPDHEAVIDQAPTLLRFVFPDEVTMTNLRIRPVNEALSLVGDVVTVRLPRNRIGQSTAFGAEIDLPVPNLEPGLYQVVFQVRTNDGHMLADDYTFTITSP